MKLKGTVSNVTKFGAFVDIGVHQDGLVHISELSDTFIDDPAKAVSVGDVVEVRVIGIDLKRRRISLSRKKQRPTHTEQRDTSGSPQPHRSAARGPSRPAGHSAHGEQRRSKNAPQKARRPIERKSYTVEDLVAKFSSKP